jgi:hypothetical protein
MRNITLAIDEQTVNPPAKDGLDKFLVLAEEAHGHSFGLKWTRDELHERR